MEENRTAARATPDAAKVYAAIAEIISRREGRRVRLVSIKKENENEQQKAG